MGNGRMVSEAPDIRRVDGKTMWTSSVRGSTVDSLWFAVPQAFQGMVSPLADAAVLGLLMPAMRQGSDLHIRGPVSADLYATLNIVQEIIIRSYPVYSRVMVTCTEFDHSVNRPDGVAMGFSAGIDSLAALHQHHLDPHPGSRRLTHLLFNNVGSHGSGQQGYNVFRRRLTHVQHASVATGLPLISLDSNLDEHFDLGPHFPMTAFLQTAFMRNAAAAHVLAGGVGTWLYPASHTLTHMGLKAPSSAFRAEPMVMSLLSSAKMRPQGVGHESRVEKTALVAALPSDLMHMLDVCVHPGHGAPVNCSRCHKCMRTMLTLEVLGVLEDFVPTVFHPWDRGDRAKFMAEVLADPTYTYNVEIIQAATNHGWTWPRRTTARGMLLRTRRTTTDSLRRARQTIKGRGVQT